MTNNESDTDTDTDNENIVMRNKSWSIDSRSYSISSNDEDYITPNSRKPSFEIIVKIEDASSNNIYEQIKHNLNNSIKIENHNRVKKRRARDMNNTNIIAYSPPNLNEYFKTLSISNNKHK